MRVASSVLVCLALLGVSSGAHDLAAASSVMAQESSFLGYRVGEERRYVLAAEDGLESGEMGSWSVRLDQVDPDEHGGVEGTFSLAHEWQAATVIEELPTRTVIRVVSDGTLRVNQHGFPTLIRFNTTRHLYGAGNEGYSVDYRLEDDNDSFEKQTTRVGKRWYQGVRIRGDYEVRDDQPSGVFAFLPSAPGCFGVTYPNFEVRGSVPARNTPGASAAPVSAPSEVSKEADNADCEESMFAAPGLLDFAMEALWEAEGTREFVFFTPLGPTSEPAWGVQVIPPAGSSGVPLPPNGLPPGADRSSLPTTTPNSMPRVAGTPLSPYDHHEFETLSFVERVPVRIGSRMPEAWMITIGNPDRRVYVDDSQRVLRIDLGSTDTGGARYIRALWPSEF